MILSQIVQAKNAEIQSMKASCRSLKKAISSARGIAVIAEIKKASPSRGVIEKILTPEERFKKYMEEEVAAVSVVTEKNFFEGSTETLRKLSAISPVPLLRKDFIIDPIQLYESLFLGADAVLLIASLLEGKKLSTMVEKALELGLEVLLEVHTPEELRRAMDTPAEVIGINNRNLEDFSIDLGVTQRMMDLARKLESPLKRKMVSESGVSSLEDALFLASCGVDALLVGTYLVEAENPQERIREIVERTKCYGEG